MKMDNNFNLYSKYYDLLYENKDYDAEANYISDCVKNYLPNAKTILEFGSGTGVHGLILQKMGYDIYGLERSIQMIEKVRLLKDTYHFKEFLLLLFPTVSQNFPMSNLLFFYYHF